MFWFFFFKWEKILEKRNFTQNTLILINLKLKLGKTVFTIRFIIHYWKYFKGFFFLPYSATMSTILLQDTVILSYFIFITDRQIYFAIVTQYYTWILYILSNTVADKNDVNEMIMFSSTVFLYHLILSHNSLPRYQASPFPQKEKKEISLSNKG